MHTSPSTSKGEFQGTGLMPSDGGIQVDLVSGIEAPGLRHLPAVDVTRMAEVEVKIQMFLDD